MEAEYWFMLAIAVVLALGLGFAAGRMSAPTQRRVQEMEKERDAARTEAESVRKEVNRHFEESARMFGKLADDYRSFFQQFARTAQNLGLSEGHARQLLQQADPSLVAADDAAKRATAENDAAATTNDVGDANTARAGDESADRDADIPAAPREEETEEQKTQKRDPADPRAEASDAPARSDDAEPAQEPEGVTDDADRTDEAAPDTRKP